MPSENGHHDWYVLVKIWDTEDMGQTQLELYAQDVADSVYPKEGFESAHVVMDDGFGRYIRPQWAKDHEVIWEPSEKSPAIDNALTAMFGVDRRESIKENICIAPPIGCGQPISNFSMWSEIEQAEYKISGLCKSCQAEIFG